MLDRHDLELSFSLARDRVPAFKFVRIGSSSRFSDLADDLIKMRNLLDVTQLRESVLQSLDACRISSKAYVKEKFGGKADFCVEVAVPKRYVTKVEQPKGQEWRHVYLVKNYDLQFPLRPMEEIMV